MSATTGLLGAGVTGAVAFVAVFSVDGATRPEYRPTYHPVSALALGPRGWVQAANFVVCGSLLAISAVGVHQASTGPWLATSIAVLGGGLVASGAYPMDPMRGYPPGTPPGTPTETSRHHDLHDHAGLVVFAMMPVATAVGAITLDDTAWSIGSGAVAAVTAATGVAFGIAWEGDHPRTGLIQRLTIVSGFTWIAAVCWHLITSPST